MKILVTNDQGIDSVGVHVLERSLLDLGDITIAEQGSTIGFAGKRVIQDTIREELPIDFQKAEYLKEHGMVDIVCHRKDLKSNLENIINHIT